MTMKERPIIFAAESVRAILGGHKTQTRRVVKPQHHFSPEMCKPEYCANVNPLFKPGTSLWVKEAWWLHMGLDGKCVPRYVATERSRPDKVRSPLFMPRWASRITLEVTLV